MINRFTSVLLALALVVVSIDSFTPRAFAQETGGQTFGPHVSESIRNDTSRPLGELAEEWRAKVRPVSPTKAREIQFLHPAGRSGRTGATPEPSVGEQAPTSVRAPMPSPGLSFEGISNANNASVLGFSVLPPDPNGDVGPNHYVQMVNLLIAVYSKSGATLMAPTDIQALWSGFEGLCENNGQGDPIVLYDHLADRWFISQFAFAVAGFNLKKPFHQCIAVSQSANPTGAYHRYDFLYHDSLLNDYPKFGVWPDAYYMSVNQFDANAGLSYAGVGVVAYERAAMLAGLAATQVRFDLGAVSEDYFSLLPSDLDGAAPASGTPNFFVGIEDDGLGFLGDFVDIWEFDVDFTTETATFGVAGLPNDQIATSSFDSNLCNFGSNRDCIPQPGVSSSAYLDSIPGQAMHRAQYRNFGTHETLVLNQTVDVGSAPSERAGIHWAELRDGGSGWGLHQNGIHAPDSTHRWMGSISMDGQGNISLGYSVSSSTLEPGIRYVGRLAGDPLGTLPQTEATLIAGGGHQESSSSRWGDYSMMAVDPSDDCTFWYTNEYYAATSSAGWRTRIGAFQTPSCSADLSITKIDSTDPVTAGNDLTYTITVDNLGPDNAGGVVVSDTLPAGVTFVSASGGGTYNAGTNTATWNLGLITPAQSPVSRTLTVNVSPSTTGTINNTATVSSSTSDPNASNNSDTEATNVSAPEPADLSITKTDSPDPVTAGNDLTYTITVDNLGPNDALGVTVSDPLPAGVSFVSATGGGSYSAGSNTVTWSLGTITPAQAPVVLTLTVKVGPSTTGTINNTASVSSSSPDPDTSNNSDSESTSVNASADLSITKADSPDPLTAGSNLTYTITVDNLGPSSATGVTVSDPLPAGVTFVSASGGGTYSSGTNTVTWSLGTVTPAQAPIALTLIVNVNASTTGLLSNTASVSSSSPDPNAANNSDTETTGITASADLSITKTDSPDPVTAGDNLTYTITVDNLGPSNASDVTVNDTLPSGTTFSSASSGGIYDATSNEVTWSLGIVTPEQAPVVLTLIVSVDASTTGTLINTASVSSSTTDAVSGNNSDTETTSVGFPSGYWVEGFGAVHPFGGAEPATGAPSFGFDIARSVAALPGGGGYVLDGFGGQHPFASSGGSAPPLIFGAPYFSGFDIARDIAINTGGPGAFFLDGWGGIHSAGGAASTSGAPYFAGFDIARAIALEPDGTGGYLLDGFGGVHPFGIGGNASPPLATGLPYFAGNDIARDLVLLPGGGGYILDGFGGVHPFGIGGAPPAAVSGSPYTSGNDQFRGLLLLEDLTGGYVMDRSGAFHPFKTGAFPLPPAMPTSGTGSTTAAKGLSVR